MVSSGTALGHHWYLQVDSLKHVSMMEPQFLLEQSTHEHG